MRAMGGDFFFVDVSTMDEPRKTISNCAIDYTRGLLHVIDNRGFSSPSQTGSSSNCAIWMKLWVYLSEILICYSWHHLSTRSNALNCPIGFWLALLFPSWIQVQFILLDPLTDHSSVPHELSIQRLKRCECFVLGLGWLLYLLGWVQWHC